MADYLLQKLVNSYKDDVSMDNARQGVGKGKLKIHKTCKSVTEQCFYDDLVYRIRKIVGKSNFSEQFRKLKLLTLIKEKDITSILCGRLHV